jgi:cytochrome c oxidase subunit 3
MGTLSSSVVLKDSKTGDRGPKPPIYGGDSGGPDGGSSSRDLDRLRRARLGLVLVLVTVTMIFVSFTSAFVIRKGLPTIDEKTGAYVNDWTGVSLPVSLLLINTTLLILSSLSVELARRQIFRRAALAPVQAIPGVSVGEDRSFPWLGATVVLGLGFLIGQWIVWQELRLRGFYLATTPSSSFFYLLTAAHAVHLFGGVVALLSAQSISWLRRPVETQRIWVDVTAWYWHFMALLWVYIFALLYFAR